MIKEDLFNSILIKPALQGANKLYIVSGFATAAMAFHHLQYLRKLNKNIELNLLVGMSSLSGITLSNHTAFKKLVQDDFLGQFSCSYIMSTPPVHSKVYAWYKDKNPFNGFIGSANYTQKAFGNLQYEAMDNSDPSLGFEYFNTCLSNSIYCTHYEIENFIKIYSDREYIEMKKEVGEHEKVKDTDLSKILGFSILPSVTISFLNQKGELPQHSGLNWSFRKEYVRPSPNEAYIRVPSYIAKTDFFPEKGEHFTVQTDDHKSLMCTIAQQNRKAIETPHNNSLIGEYFRNRLGLPNGVRVLKDDLLRYGRTDVTFYKIDEETYYMDFSVV